MKNVSLLIAAILLLSTPVMGQEPVIDEGQRQQALLQIWKDHVKTLTRERDQALDELEKLKSQGPVPALEVVPTVDHTAILEKERQIEELNVLLAASEGEKQNLAQAQAGKDRLIAELQSKIQSASAAAVPAQDAGVQQAEIAQLKSQIDVWQKKYQILEDASRLQQARIKDLSKKSSQSPVAMPTAPKNSTPSEADAALKRENDALKAKLEQLEDKQKRDLVDAQALAEASERNQSDAQDKIKELDQMIKGLEQKNKDADLKIAESQKKIKELERMNVDLEQGKRLAEKKSDDSAKAMKQAESAQNRSKELEAQIAKIEKESVEMRDKLKSSEQAAAEARQALENSKKELDSAKKEIEATKKEIEAAKKETESSKKIADEAKKETEQRTGQIQALLQQAEAERDRLLERNASLEKAASLHGEILKKAEEDKIRLQESYAILSTKFEEHKKEDEANAQLLEVEREKINTMKASLDADQADLNNFKSNIETYLESLTASFEERRKG